MALFPDLQFQGEETIDVDAGIFETHEVVPIAGKDGLPCGQFRKFEQRVWVKDKVYMCNMGPATLRFRIHRHQPVECSMVLVDLGACGQGE